ncbi:prepilin-type N-terminal cleavage/methylation domain-containing protein [Patescibacteria group bacterium]|nr:prepilin-type N-terminal cleavage/methylation domain-containing protein [Patescibacteria group bacterium]MBU1952791.1 prepilin-type N-terminal cleavage/methylation domain-containing protein [Patescibacteria group bacterium]
MVLKIPSKKLLRFSNQGGFTLVELLATSTIALILLALAIVYFNPAERIKRARDGKRLSDISKIDRAISEFMLDKKYYPDTQGVLRLSTALPEGSTSLNKSNKGWIFDNLSSYIPMLPTDPLNDETYHYSYIRGSDGYELDAKLELMTDEMLNDGGNDNLMYEVGSNLNLISP